MRKKIILFLFLSIAAFAFEFETYSSVEQVSGHRAYVLVVESYCPWCKKFKNNVLTDSEVAKKLEPYKVAIIMRNDWNKKGIWKGHVKYVPTMFFLDEDKKIIKRQDGYLDKDEFLEMIDSLYEEF